MRTTCRPGRRHAALRRSCWLVSLSLFAFALPATAFAQSSSASAAEPEPLDEVIVTARKAEENLQDIPMSVQVMSAELLDKLDLTRLIDLQFNVPGLVVNNLGLNGAGFSLRGIADQGGSSLSVASYWNGVYLGSSRLSIARMFDLERIEVLKGPQGTLYGRNATGGSINVITQSPQDDFSANLEVAYGSFDTARVSGHVNMPFDSAAFRLAFTGSEGDGFIRNSVDSRKFAEQDFRGLRASLAIYASERLQFDVVVQHVEDDGASDELWLPRPDFLADPSDIRLTTVTLANPFLESKNDMVSARFAYDLGFATVRSVTGYARNEIDDLDDCAGIPILLGCIRGVRSSRHRQWSEEVQLVSQESASVDWIVGAYYYGDESAGNFFQLTPVIDPEPTIDRLTDTDATAYAVFSQATWAFADSWSITAGLRLNDEEYRLSTFGTGTDDSPTTVSDTIDGNNTSWRLDLEHTVTDDVLVYAGVSTGFKSGGINIQPGGVLDSFGAEDLTAYEAGAKTQWLDRRLTLNAAAFYYDFRDLQVSTSTITDSGIIFETDNAAKAEIYGIDTNGKMRITERVTVSGGIVWLPKREFVEYRNDSTGDTLSGNQLTRSPEWTATAAIEFDRPLRNVGNVSARLEYNYRSDFSYTTDNDPRFAQDGFGLLNIFLNFEPSDGKWYAFASGRNLGNEDYFNQVFLQASPGYPDSYELGFGYRF